jgi:hypothetical protein
MQKQSVPSPLGPQPARPARRNQRLAASVWVGGGRTAANGENDRAARHSPLTRCPPQRAATGSTSARPHRSAHRHCPVAGRTSRNAVAEDARLGKGDGERNRRAQPRAPLCPLATTSTPLRFGADTVRGSRKTGPREDGMGRPVVQRATYTPNGSMAATGPYCAGPRREVRFSWTRGRPAGRLRSERPSRPGPRH